MMTRKEFEDCLDKYRGVIEEIKQSAHQVHEQVNQRYDKVHPYGFHLDMVADGVCRYGHEVCNGEEDVLPMVFGAYYHDSIEDARLTYHDVEEAARRFMDDRQAYMAAEIVFALTNEKGRTRAERAGEKYYQDIRETPYAPFVKLADRLANTAYSFAHSHEGNARMKDVYRQEMPHFLEAITVTGDDRRYSLPADMVGALMKIIGEKR